MIKDTDPYQALVVDDEPSVLSITMRALGREGFQCDGASDGNEASQLLHSQSYDVVVTDLRMPNKHGHALAVELLSLDTRPLVVVLTGVLEPRLAKDLLLRGVDDIVFKPVDYGTFAAKVKALVRRRSTSTAKTPETASTSKAENSQGNNAAETDDCKAEVDADAEISLKKTDHTAEEVSVEEFERELLRVAEVLPITPAALDVYRMAESDNIDRRRLAEAISQHELLSEEVIHLARSKFYNRDRVIIKDLGRAVVQIGQQRVGKLALAANAMAALAPGNPGWLDVSAVWRKSVAAGLAIEMLIAQGNHQKIANGLLLCATMHALGRLILGSLFPRQYEAAVQLCSQRNEPLVEHERRMFPQSQSEVMLGVLVDWNIPPDACRPLQYVCHDYASLSELAEPLRSQTELVKLAALFAQIAIGTWEPWELVELPPTETLERLRIGSVSSVIDEAEANTEGINTFQTQATPSPGVRRAKRQSTAMAYWKASPGSCDLLADVLGTMDLELRPPSDVDDSDERLILNCLGASAHDTSWSRSPRTSNLIICERDAHEGFSGLANAVSLPTSYATLRAAVVSRGLPKESLQ